MKVSPKSPPSSQQAKKVYEELWLNYFNSVLLANNLVTEDQYKVIKRQIILRSGRK